MEYSYDFSKISIKEYRSLFDPKQPNSEEYEIMARCAGLEPIEVENMPFDEWRRFSKGLFDAAKLAGTEKNSASESTEA